VALEAVVAVAAFPVVLWLSVGKSAATAIEGTPVLVVFLRIPVDSPANETPFNPLADVAVVADPAVVAVAAFPVVLWLSMGKSAATAIDGAPVPEASVTSPVWVAFETLAVLITCWSKMAELIRPLVLVVATGIASLPPVRWVLAWSDGMLTPASEIVKM